MLRKNSEEGLFFIRINDLKCMTVCAKKRFRKPFLQVAEYKDGDSIVIQTDKWVEIDLMGSFYMEKNNIEIHTKLEEDQQIARVAICKSLLTGKGLVEVIELTDGTVLVSPLNKGVITEKVEASWIEEQFNRAFERT